MCQVVGSRVTAGWCGVIFGKSILGGWFGMKASLWLVSCRLWVACFLGRAA